jgi:tRNA(Ile)-lysidine synthetase-like protein
LFNLIEKLPKRLREKWDHYARIVLDGVYANKNSPYNILVVSFSGGPDSTALLYACVHLRDNFERLTGRYRDLTLFPDGYKLNIIAAHLDHAIRANSQDDAEWCANLAKVLDVEFVLKRLGESELEKKRWKSGVGIETAAREFRRAFQIELAMELLNSGFVTSGGKVLTGLPVLLNGHTANDQAETVLMNLARGSGFCGACGIAKRTAVSPLSSINEISLEIVRPFLDLPKSDLLNLLDASKFDYLMDETNLDKEFTPRNTIRSVVIPALEKFYPSTVRHLTEFATLAQSNHKYVVEQADLFLKDYSFRFCDLFKELRLFTHKPIEEDLLPKVHLRKISSPVRFEIYTRLFKQYSIVLTNALMQDIEKLVYSDDLGEIQGIVEASTKYIWVHPCLSQKPTDINDSKEAIYEEINRSLSEVMELKELINSFSVPVHLDSVHTQRIKIEGTGKRMSLKTYYRNVGIPESVIARISVLADAKGKVFWYPHCTNKFD